jgi:hypothetical protein
MMHDRMGDLEISLFGGDFFPEFQVVLQFGFTRKKVWLHR